VVVWTYPYPCEKVCMEPTRQAASSLLLLMLLTADETRPSTDIYIDYTIIHY
jgi:hypothetical protein